MIKHKCETCLLYFSAEGVWSHFVATFLKHSFDIWKLSPNWAVFTFSPSYFASDTSAEDNSPGQLLHHRVQKWWFRFVFSILFQAAPFLRLFPLWNCDLLASASHLSEHGSYYNDPGVAFISPSPCTQHLLLWAKIKFALVSRFFCGPIVARYM